MVDLFKGNTRLLSRSAAGSKRRKVTYQSSAVRPLNASTAAEGCWEENDDGRDACLCCCCSCCSAERHSVRSLGSTISTLRRFSGTGGACGSSAARFSIVEERRVEREEKGEVKCQAPVSDSEIHALTFSTSSFDAGLRLALGLPILCCSVRPSSPPYSFWLQLPPLSSRHGQSPSRLALGKNSYSTSTHSWNARSHEISRRRFGDATFFPHQPHKKASYPPQNKQGAAVIAAPQHQLTIAAGAAAIQGVRALAGAAKERKLRRKQEAEAGEESDSSSSVPPSRDPSSSALSLSAEAKKDDDSSNVNVTQPVDLVWSDLSVLVPDKAAAAAAVASGAMGKRAAARKLKKAILCKVSGVAAAGRLVAIMGPSGGGKTTLLHALAGQLARAPGLEATGSVVALVPAAAKKEGGETPSASKRSPTRSPPRVAFVQQSDEFFSMLTVRETLELAARLRAKRETPEAEIAATAEALMRRLGLAKVADARVGGGRARGLSGGERKRLSIACELVGSPAVLFADEPTSGLDSFQAERVVAALSELAKVEGRTVVASIHQPRSSAFSLFDDLVLLAEGRCAYSGPAADALSYFASAEGGGHRCPSHFNPAEFLADLVSVDHSSPEAEEETRARVQGITDAWAARAEKESGGAGAAELSRHRHHHHASRGGGSRTSFLTQLSLLGKRAWRQTTRDKATALARAASSLSSAFIFGSIYWRLGKGQASIQDRMGLLQVSAINAAMSALVKTLSAFPRVRRFWVWLF